MAEAARSEHRRAARITLLTALRHVAAALTMLLELHFGLPEPGTTAEKVGCG